MIRSGTLNRKEDWRLYLMGLGNHGSYGTIRFSHGMVTIGWSELRMRDMLAKTIYSAPWKLSGACPIWFLRACFHLSMWCGSLPWKISTLLLHKMANSIMAGTRIQVELLQRECALRLHLLSPLNDYMQSPENTNRMAELFRKWTWSLHDPVTVHLVARLFSMTPQGKNVEDALYKNGVLFVPKEFCIEVKSFE